MIKKKEYEIMMCLFEQYTQSFFDRSKEYGENYIKNNFGDIRLSYITYAGSGILLRLELEFLYIWAKEIIKINRI